MLPPIRPVLVQVLLLAACGTDQGAPTLGSTAIGDAAAPGDDGPLGDRLAGADGAGSADATAVDGGAVLSDATIFDGTAPGDTVAGQDGVPGQDSAPGADSGTATPDTTYPDVPSKYELCSTLMTCVTVSCDGASNKSCAATCTDVASPAAKAAIAPFVACLDQYCFEGMCKGSSDSDCVGVCVMTKCLPKMIGCLADGKSGKATCDTAFGCIDTCQEEGFGCMGNCWSAMTPQAQADFDAITACTNAAGGENPYASCTEQLFKCLSAGKVGTKTCLELMSCNVGCNGSSKAKEAICNGVCYGQSSAAAQQAWLGVAQCDPGGNETACAQGIVACSDPTGTKTCLDTISCNDACKKSGKPDGECLFACLHQASKVEAQKTVDLFLCVEKQCKPGCDGNKTCEDKCMQSGTCKAQFKGCLGT